LEGNLWEICQRLLIESKYDFQERHFATNRKKSALHATIFLSTILPFFNSIFTLKKGNLLDVTKICQGLRGAEKLLKCYPQMPLIAVTDFSGRRMKLGVIVTPIFPICSIS
jgi:hypothetical protein